MGESHACIVLGCDCHQFFSHLVTNVEGGNKIVYDFFRHLFIRSC